MTLWPEFESALVQSLERNAKRTAQSPTRSTHFTLRRQRAGAAAVAATAVGIVVALVVGGGGVGSSNASAAQLLRSAAEAAANQPSPHLGPGEFYFVRGRTTTLVPISRSGAGTVPREAMLAPKARVTIDTWQAWSPTQVGAERIHVVDVSFPTSAARRRWEALGRPKLFAGASRVRRVPRLGNVIEILGPRSITVPQLLALPDTARRVYERLFAGVPGSVALNVAFQCLYLYPLASGLRTAIYRALALVPGIHAGGKARTLTGAVGDVLWARAGGLPGVALRAELIVDPHSGTVLGTRTVIAGPHSLLGVPAGTVYAQGAVVVRTETSSPGPPAGR